MSMSKSASDGAFGDGAGGEVAGEGVHVLVGEGLVFGEGDGEVAEAAGLGEADGDAGAFADFVDGERLGFAEADDEQALGLDAGGGVEQEGFAEGGFELAGGEPGRGGVGDGVGGGEQRGVRLLRPCRWRCRRRRRRASGVWKASA